jgi:hypothetical protein
MRPSLQHLSYTATLRTGAAQVKQASASPEVSNNGKTSQNAVPRGRCASSSLHFGSCQLHPPTRVLSKGIRVSVTPLAPLQSNLHAVGPSTPWCRNGYVNRGQMIVPRYQAEAARLSLRPGAGRNHEDRQCHRRYRGRFSGEADGGIFVPQVVDH